ncbi:P-type conjugative transfer protein TrbJ [Pigmentiphaga daeguensis]|uniref:P-type conjugative transfer protein TrbJ n=1 Tax=Pigmentiphaga daeguensis TaxID=414049 RepID=A0ABN1CH27_9BURK
MKRLLVPAVLCAALAAHPAHALTVFDPTNFSQNILTAARTLEMINNQIRQLQNEAQMLTHDAMNLTGLDFNAISRLRTSLSSTTSLMNQARGLTFDVSRAEAEFARLYPAQYDATISNDAMAQDARERWSQSLDALRTTANVQSQAVQNLGDDEGVLSDLVQQSQSAVGALQATQATNQLLALQAKQSIQHQQLQIAQDRAMALDRAQEAAEDARAQEVRRRFSRDRANYTPQPVQFYQ